MGRFNHKRKFLNSIFYEENQKWLDVIVATYKEIKIKNPVAYEIATNRFRKKEFYIKTCVRMNISPKKYYRLLRIFFETAEKILSAKIDNSMTTL